MTDIPLTPDEEDDALAAEYVLGVQDLAERMAVEARIKADPAFAARVTQWETRLAGLNDGFPETPAPNLLPQIEARLFPAPPRPARRGLFWLFAPLAAALALAAVFFLTPREAVLVATLQTEDAALAYEARHLGDTLTITRVAGQPAAAGQVHELWVIAPGAARCRWAFWPTRRWRCNTRCRRVAGRWPSPSNPQAAAPPARRPARSSSPPRSAPDPGDHGCVNGETRAKPPRSFGQDGGNGPAP